MRGRCPGQITKAPSCLVIKTMWHYGESLHRQQHCGCGMLGKWQPAWKARNAPRMPVRPARPRFPCRADRPVMPAEM